MISNLITSLLVACAVGGTTASAFNDKPKEAINIQNEEYNTSEGTTTVVAEVNTENYTPTVVETADNIYTTYYQMLSNNPMVQISACIYINNYKTYNPQTSSMTTAIGNIITVYKIDMYNGYDWSGGEVDQIANVVASTSDANITIRSYWSYTFHNTLSQDNYVDLIGRSIINQTQWDALNTRYQQMFSGDIEKDNDVMDYIGGGQTKEAELQHPYEASVENVSNHMIIATRENLYLYGTYPHPTSSTISYKYFTARMLIDPNGANVVEPVNIPGMMYTILTMPFSFISQAFNLTIFAGTPYAVNLTDVILTILVILIVLLIIKILMRFIK